MKAVWGHEIPCSCSARRLGSMPEDRAVERTLPKASVNVFIHPPAFPKLRNTSVGCEFPELIVAYKVPWPVIILVVSPISFLGLFFSGSPNLSMISGLPAACRT